MSKLKKCPFCGEKPKQSTDEDGTFVWCTNSNCCAYGGGFGIDDWQSRPLEDALTAERDEWKEAHNSLARQLSIANDDVEEALDEICAMVLPDEIHKYAQEIMDKIKEGGLPKLRKQLEAVTVERDGLKRAGLRLDKLLVVAMKALKKITICKDGKLWRDEKSGWFYTHVYIAKHALAEINQKDMLQVEIDEINHGFELQSQAFVEKASECKTLQRKLEIHERAYHKLSNLPYTLVNQVLDEIDEALKKLEA